MLPRDVYKIVRIANVYFGAGYKIVESAFFLYWQNLEAFSLPIKFDGVACGGDFF